MEEINGISSSLTDKSCYFQVNINMRRNPGSTSSPSLALCDCGSSYESRDLFFTCKCMIGKLKRGRDESLWVQEFLPRVWNKLPAAETFSLENESWIWNAQIFCLLMHQILFITYTCELVTKGLVLTLVVTSNGVQWFTGETRDYTSLRVLNRVCPNLPCHSSFHPVQSASWEVTIKNLYSLFYTFLGCFPIKIILLNCCSCIFRKLVCVLLIYVDFCSPRSFAFAITNLIHSY